MNLSKNYYQILGVDKTSSLKEIKKKYYDLSKQYHPDVNKDTEDIFKDIAEAYNILSNITNRESYDKKSIFGCFYNEYYELFKTDFNVSFEEGKSKFDTFTKNEVDDIYIKINPDTFNGNITYERWVVCKSCDGQGSDMVSKIHIRDNDGNILKTFDAEDGCDFCEGTGIDYLNQSCKYCYGKGKIGINPCKVCKGDKRILGKQKLKNIKITGDETILKNMGNHSKDEPGKIGSLILIKDK